MRTFLMAAMLACSTGAIAHAQEAARPLDKEAATSASIDPWEKFNRSIFAFNEGVDRTVLSPVAHGYRAVTPKFFRTGVSNFLSNLNTPVIFANDVLQVAPVRAGATVARFGINSTVGVAGLFDVASKAGIAPHSEDFGQTLGRWGVGSGPYLVLPLFGPSNVRDALGKVVDVAFNPLLYTNFEGDTATGIGINAVTVVSQREAGIEAIDSVYATSIDPYVSIRTTYNIFRKEEIKNGHSNVQDLPDFEDKPADAVAPTPSQPSPPNETH